MGAVQPSFHHLSQLESLGNFPAQARCHCRSSSPNFSRIVRFGSFYRSSDHTTVHRFRCQDCLRTFSQATGQPCFGMKKRQTHAALCILLTMGVSLRRVARILKLNRKTVAVKVQFLGEQAGIAHQKFLETHFLGEERKIKELQFDELETFERSKCLPVSVPLVVEASSRFILGIDACSMPPKGPLAQISFKKYGLRKDDRAKTIQKLLEELKPYIHPNATVTSDQCPRYPSLIAHAWPGVTHKTVKGKRGCIVGQGELKKVAFDPLFSLNHTCAMLRYSISRLIRKTWNTTKRISALKSHLVLYMFMHNQRILEEIRVKELRVAL